MVASPPVQITREGFLLAVAAGVYGEQNVELLDGQVYEVMSENHPHRFATMLLLEALQAAYGRGYLVRTEMGLPLGRSQPKPDVAVIRWNREELRGRDEGAEDVVLLVEVVDTGVGTARIKRDVYARAGIAEYWILDVNARTLVVLSDPQGGVYARERTLRAGDAVMTGSPEAAIHVGELLP